MKKIIFIICLLSATAFADQYEYGKRLRCTGAGFNPYKISSIDIFEFDTMYSARIQRYPTKEVVYSGVTEEGLDHYYITSPEVGNFLLKRGWSGNWIFMSASAEQYESEEVDCQ